MKAIGLLVLALGAFAPSVAQAMCGCMVPIRPKRPRPNQIVAKKILNEASKVILVRNGEQTIMTMSNDVITDYDAFGLVVPVPTVIKKKDVRVVGDQIFARLEKLTNPRVVEKWDPSPCPGLGDIAMAEGARAPSVASGGARRSRAKAADYGVKVEAHYSVGEYDIAILSAKQGAGAKLMKWLNKFHYAVPEEAVPVLQSYIKQNMKFFVAKVDFRKVDRSKKRVFLRPIQVRYETPRFMLPVRLGTVNAAGPQELVAYMLSPKGRIEATNYRTIKMPSGQDLPMYVKNDFENTYKAIFDFHTKKHEMHVLFTEYVGRGTLGIDNYKKTGLGWGSKRLRNPRLFDHFTTTRLHFRYDKHAFPEDLILQETSDIKPFNVRYTVHHPATNTSCPAGKSYLDKLPARRANEAEALASLTGWELGAIRGRVGLPPTKRPGPTPPMKKKVKGKPKKGLWQRIFE